MRRQLEEKERISRAPDFGVAARPSYRSAVVLACVLCGLFTFTALLVPPSLSHDAGWGMQVWRAYRGGGPINMEITPDSDDISQDHATFVTWWSPGQYLVPGAITLTGLRIGSALAITAGASLLLCLLGWICVAKKFGFGTLTTLLLVLFIATFRYSTLPFDVYDGGEILLQGLTPWLILAGSSVPYLKVLQAGGLACLMILIAFFAKLTGLVVAGAALFAGSVEVLVRLRKVTSGMLAGAAGSVVAFVALYIGWFSRGTTPASGTGWEFRLGDIFFALGAPWSAGISWSDMMTSLLFNARHPILRSGPQNGDVSVILWLFLLPTVVFLVAIWTTRRQWTRDANLTRLLIIAVCFYALCTLAMSVIFSRGGDVSLEERHLRAAGMLIVVCVVAIVGRMPRNSVISIAVIVLCGFMSLYGFATFAYRAWSTRHQPIDSYSGTHQPSMDESAIQFLRTALTHDGRDAVFVLPSPDAASVLPPTARVLSDHIAFDSEAEIAARTYRGKTRGPLYVVVPSDLAQTTKARLLLKEFTDYPFKAWESRSFGNSTIFVQSGSTASN